MRVLLVAVTGCMSGPDALAAYPERAIRIAEAGVPGYEITAWGGYMAPAGTPAPIVARLNSELNKVVASPAIRDRWVALGIEPVGGTPEYFAEYVRKEIAKWTDVIRRAGIKGDY
jgi:tripartite-type tricarboxylate transporter receptor subunit TctC